MERNHIYGNRTAGTTSHDGWTQSYHLAAGLPNQLRYGTAAVASTPWTSYDAVSWALLDIGYGNGVHSAFSYDKDQARLTGVTHGPNNSPFAKWTYTWDQDTGNLSRENDQLTGGFDQYMYDELNRLVAAVVQSSTYGEQLQQFDYDAFGNRTSSNLMRVTAWSEAKGASNATTTVSGLTNVATSQVVNAAFAQGSSALLQNRLPATTATGVPTGAVYDAQGNLTQVFEKPTSVSPAVVSMTYDALGRVLSVANTRTGITERYQYTAEGLRTGVQEYSGATLIKTRVNVYNDQRQLVAQYEKAAAGALTWKRDILYLGTREAAEIDAAGMHVTMVDHLGSPRVVVGPSGTVEARQKFLPFGEFLEQSGTFKTAKGYTNHEQTDSSGLIYMQARFYHPGFGRFTAPDPARDQHFDNTQSWNIYSYVRNNPIMSTDPTGMLADQLNATQTMGPQGAMSGSGDYSFMWGNDVMELGAGNVVAQDVVAQTQFVSEATFKSMDLENRANVTVEQLAAAVVGAEVRGQGEKGAEAVASSVMNRVDSSSGYTKDGLTQSGLSGKEATLLKVISAKDRNGNYQYEALGNNKTFINTLLSGGGSAGEKAEYSKASTHISGRIAGTATDVVDGRKSYRSNNATRNPGHAKSHSTESIKGNPAKCFQVGEHCFYIN